MNSGMMPSFIHHTDSLVRPPAPREPNGAPLSQRIPERQAVLVKSPFETGLDAFDRRLGYLQLDEVPADTVRRRQRIDPSLIASAKPALEVRTPLVVGLRGRRAGPSLVERPAAPLHRRHQTSALEDGPDRRGRRPGDLGGPPIKHSKKLARPQMRELPSGCDHLRCNRFVRGLPALQRCVRAIHEPFRIAALLALAPFVKRIAAHLVPSAQLRHAPVTALVLRQHQNTLFHPTGLFERHRRALPPIHLGTCRQSCRSNLSGIYPVCTAEPGS